MTVKKMFSIILARKKIVSLVWILIVATVTVLSLIVPKKYEATSEIIVDVKAPDSVMGSYGPAIMLPAYMATQLNVIESRRVADKVIETLKLDQEPAFVDAWREDTDGVGDIRPWLFESLSKQLTVKPSRESSFISISYAATDSQFAAIMANAYTRAYIDVTLDMKVSPAGENAAWFKERVETLKNEIDVAQRSLSDFRKEKGIVGDTRARLDSENSRLNELASQLSLAQSQGADASSRTAGGNDLSSLPEVIQNPLIQSIRVQIADVRSKVQDASSRLGANHPEYKRLAAQQRELEAQLSSQMSRVASSLSVANQQGSRKVESLRIEMEAQRKSVIALNADMDRMSILQQQLEVAEAAYQNVSQRYLQTNLESQATSTNINVVTQAVPPNKPSFPNVPKNVVLSVILGLIMGIAAAFVMEMTDRRVRDSRDFDVSAGLPLPLLGVIPRSTKKLSALERRYESSNKQRGTPGALPAP